MIFTADKDDFPSPLMLKAERFLENQQYRWSKCITKQHSVFLEYFLVPFLTNASLLLTVQINMHLRLKAYLSRSLPGEQRHAQTCGRFSHLLFNEGLLRWEVSAHSRIGKGKKRKSVMREEGWREWWRGRWSLSARLLCACCSFSLPSI